MTDKLDSVLREWADGHSPSDKHLRELSIRIRDDAIRAGLPMPGEDIQPVMPMFWAKLAYAASGAVVAVTVMIFALQNGVEAPPRFVGLSERRIAAGERLLGDMQALFPERLRWISESDGDMNLGVETIYGGGAEEAAPVLVRLSVVSRVAGEEKWTSVWQTDVIMRGQEIVEVMPNRDSGNRLTLWVYPLADGRIAIDLDISLDMPIRIASRKNLVVTPGASVEVMSLRDGETEYRVYQTVSVLTHG